LIRFVWQVYPLAIPPKLPPVAAKGDFIELIPSASLDCHSSLRERRILRKNFGISQDSEPTRQLKSSRRQIGLRRRSVAESYHYPVATTKIKRRRIEISAFERMRFAGHNMAMRCPVCQLSSEMLTIRQAAALAQVTAQSVRRWLAAGKAHSVKTAGGHHRICKRSLFLDTSSARIFVSELAASSR